MFDIRFAPQDAAVPSSEQSLIDMFGANKTT
jgi:hypothetical protein